MANSMIMKTILQNDTSFKLNFWSNDDSPLIRPLLKTEPYSAPRVETSKGINTHQMDGYGGIACERITRISGRSGGQWLAGYALIILSGSAVFAMLTKFKDNKRSK